MFSFEHPWNSISTSFFVKLVAVFQRGHLQPLAKPLCVVFVCQF